MSTTYGSAAVDLSSRPYAYIAIPLCVTLALLLFAIVIHSNRRKRLAKLNAAPANIEAQQARDRVLQEGWERGALGSPRRRALGMRRWSVRSGGRWVWEPSLFAARGEEGLNEHGEAPPPYHESTRQGKVVEDGIADDVEMHIRPFGSRTGECSGSAGPGDWVNEQAYTPGLQDNQVPPPAYGEPLTEGTTASPRNNERRDESGMAAVTEPPPVVLAGQHSA